MKKMTDIALLVIRSAVGVIFIAHGLQKVFGMFGGSGIAGFSGMLQSMGFIVPTFWAWVAGLSEFLGGVCLVLGVLPRISATLIGIVMMVAIFGIHGSKGFFAMQGGFEYQFLILATCVGLALTGSGKFSLYDKF
jgi:putative oxidoreductase